MAHPCQAHGLSDHDPELQIARDCGATQAVATERAQGRSLTPGVLRMPRFRAAD